jgi:acetylglutamate kinase
LRLPGNRIEHRPDILHREISMTTPISARSTARILSRGAAAYAGNKTRKPSIIKYGGHAMGDEGTGKAFAARIVLLEQTAINPVVVSWRRPADRDHAQAARHPVEFAAGLRITDAATIEIVEMVLAGSVNKQLVGYINEAGGKAVGPLRQGRQHGEGRRRRRAPWSIPDSNIEKAIDLGFVGDPDKVDLTLLNQLIGYELIPVLAPLATSQTGQTLNVNADTFAGAVAGRAEGKAPVAADRRARRARQVEEADSGTVDQGRPQADRRRHDSGGMIPKVETCIYALEQGVEGVGHHRRQDCSMRAARTVHQPGHGTLIHK